MFKLTQLQRENYYKRYLRCAISLKTLDEPVATFSTILLSSPYKNENDDGSNERSEDGDDDTGQGPSIRASCCVVRMGLCRDVCEENILITTG